MAGQQTDEDKNLVAFEFPEPKDGENTAEPTEVKLDEEVEVETEVKETSTGDSDAGDSGASDEPTEEELAQYSANVQKRIRALTKQKHEERRQREALEQERRTLQQQLAETTRRAQTFEQQAAQGQTAFVTQAQQLAETEMTQAKEALVKAYNDGSPDEFIKAQENFTKAQLKLERVKSFQARKPLQQPQEGGNVQPQQVAAPTPPQASEKLKQWLTQNAWFGKDEDLTNFARGLHVQLVANGVNPESDFYYQTISEKTRGAFPQRFETPRSQEATPRNKPAQVVAPAGRATPPKRVVLNQRQVAIANRLGIPLAEYAKQVAAMENQNG